MHNVKWEVPQDDFPGAKCLPICNFIWLSCLSIAIVLLWSISLDNNYKHDDSRAGPDLILKRIQRRFENDKSNTTMSYPFNLVGGLMGEIIRMPQKGSLPLEFDKLKHYYVCCHTADRLYFVCHSVTRNIGIDCVIRKEKTTKDIYAAIIVQHRDMFGSMCVLHWSYK